MILETDHVYRPVSLHRNHQRHCRVPHMDKLPLLLSVRPAENVPLTWFASSKSDQAGETKICAGRNKCRHATLPSTTSHPNRVTSDAHLRPVREHVTLFADRLCTIHIPESKNSAEVANPPYPRLPQPLDRPVPVFGPLNNERVGQRECQQQSARFLRFPL